MDTHVATNALTVFDDGIRAVLSLRETTVLAAISETRVRKDIETGVLKPLRCIAAEERPCFRWADVFFFGAVYKNEMWPSAFRKLVLERLEVLVETRFRREFLAVNPSINCRLRERPSMLLDGYDKMNIDDYVFLDFGKVRDDLTPRVDLYANGLGRIEERGGVLGGEAVFKNTRLSVRHIGKMFEDGESMETILEDYPYLRENDVKFARLYNEAHPMVGRPRRKRGDPEWVACS